MKFSIVFALRKHFKDTLTLEGMEIIILHDDVLRMCPFRGQGYYLQ